MAIKVVHNADILNKITGTQINRIFRRQYHNPVFPGVQGWSNNRKCVNIIHHINEPKGKNHDFLSYNRET